MNTTRRLQRFARLKELDERRREVIERQMRELAAQISQVTRRLEQAAEERRQQLNQSILQQPAERISQTAWVEYSLQISATWEAQRRELQARWATAHQAWRDLGARIDAWVRLIERLQLRQQQHEFHLETRQADEWATQRESLPPAL